MSKESQKDSLNVELVIPEDQAIKTANANHTSQDESIRAVSKAILDLTRESIKVRDTMAANGKVDLAPYFDFWFADAIPAATSLLGSEDENIRLMAECLIKQEEAIVKSKTSFLETMKNLGINPTK